MRIKRENIIKTVCIFLFFCCIYAGAEKNGELSGATDIKKSGNIEMAQRNIDSAPVEGKKEKKETADIKPYTIEDFEIIYQNPELPTGCEATALTMVLQFYGFTVSKTEVASTYLPREEYILYTDSSGRMCGPDLDNYFVGDPFSEGTVCGAGALVTAANRYLKECGSSLRAEDISGCTAEELYERICKNQPVVVLVTIDMQDRGQTTGWYTESEKYVEWSVNDHGAVLIGWNENEVTIACPIAGTENYSKEQFEKVFVSRGSKAVVIE